MISNVCILVSLYIICKNGINVLFSYVMKLKMKNSKLIFRIGIKCFIFVVLGICDWVCVVIVKIFYLLLCC